MIEKRERERERERERAKGKKREEKTDCCFHNFISRQSEWEWETPLSLARSLDTLPAEIGSPPSLPVGVINADRWSANTDTGVTSTCYNHQRPTVYKVTGYGVKSLIK